MVTCIHIKHHSYFNLPSLSLIHIYMILLCFLYLFDFIGIFKIKTASEDAVDCRGGT